MGLGRWLLASLICGHLELAKLQGNACQYSEKKLETIPENLDNMCHSLVFDINKIKRIENNTFENLPNLSLVSVKQNGLTWFSPVAIVNCPNLREVLLDGNKITQFSMSNSDGRNVIHLSLSDNYFLDMPTVGSIADTLEKLALRNNGVSGIPSRYFENFRRMISLDLSINHLTDVSELQGLTNSPIEQIFLNGNRITELAEDLFVGFARLVNLKLNDNDLTAQPSLAGTEESLQYLSMHGNEIRNLKSFKFSSFVALKIISIDPVECDCDMLTTFVGLRSRQIEVLHASGHYPSRICGSPASLSQTDFTQLVAPPEGCKARTPTHGTPTIRTIATTEPGTSNRTSTTYTTGRQTLPTPSASKASSRWNLQVIFFASILYIFSLQLTNPVMH